MLVPIIFIAALMLTLGSAMLANGFAAAKVALNTSVARYSDVAISDGVADFTGGLAAYVKAHGTGKYWPGETSESFTKSLCQPAIPLAQCPFSYTVTGTITDAAGKASPDTDTDTVANLQTSVIAEERISAVVTARVTGRNGKLFASRSRQLTYRVFNAPPYAIVSGSRDMTAVDGARASAQGDSGGAAPATDAAAPATDVAATPATDVAATATDAAAPPAKVADQYDTRIHVQLTCETITKDIKPFVNDQQSPGNAGLPWGNSQGKAYETKCHSPASPVDDFKDDTWANGNTNTSGWTQ